MNNPAKKINIAAYKAILFDLDDTLYPQNSHLMDNLLLRIHRFMEDELHFSSEEIPELRHRLYQTYGTTLRGLQSEFQVDMDTYLDYLNDVPLEDYLHQDLALGELLSSLDMPKYVLTNSDRTHAQKVLELLDITEYFLKIIDIYYLAPYCKPQSEAYQIALDLISEPPEDCLFIDDSPANLAMAQQLGMTTISVGQNPHIDSPHIQNILDLADLLL
ncbi:MAG: pyrimidine 5'-nucleotidase [Anaerolineaceae bacterium]|nr:pyrimidine 5'-nucleotidase [Anaerolineaceae bacterium]